jgi:putative oxidoreductase
MNPAVIPASWSLPLQSIFRIVIGLLFLQHGTAKILGFPHLPHLDALPLMSLAGVSGLIELVGGVFITVGLFTRITAFVLSGEMAVAYFMAHAPRSLFPILNMGELAVLYCFAFLYIAAAGAGPWSLDANRGVANP